MCIAVPEDMVLWSVELTHLFILRLLRTYEDLEIAQNWWQGCKPYEFPRLPSPPVAASALLDML